MVTTYVRSNVDLWWMKNSLCDNAIFIFVQQWEKANNYFSVAPWVKLRNYSNFCYLNELNRW